MGHPKMLFGPPVIAAMPSCAVIAISRLLRELIGENGEGKKRLTLVGNIGVTKRGSRTGP